jgi:PAS domain S-box-containing protein
MDQRQPAIILLTNLAGRFQGINDRALAGYGYSREELWGLSLEDLSAPESRQSLVQHIKNIQKVTEVTFDAVHLRKDGSRFPVTVFAHSLVCQNNVLLHYRVREQTAQQRLVAQVRQQDQQLLQIDKMAALSTLVSGIAHEINNPVNLIQLNGQLLAEIWSNAKKFFDRWDDASETPLLGELSNQEARDAVPALLDGIIQGAHEVERVVADLKAYVRPNDTRIYGVFNLNEAIQRVLNLLSHVIKKKTTCFQIDLQTSLPLLRGDRRSIEQVVVNLVLNALEALPDKSSSVVLVTRRPAAARHVELQVQDQGWGIAPESVERVCEPFFTTKQDSGGTGLGLFVAYKLIHAQGGALSFYSKLGEGTTVKVILPIAEPVAEPSENLQEDF